MFTSYNTRTALPRRAALLVCFASLLTGSVAVAQDTKIDFSKDGAGPEVTCKPSIRAEVKKNVTSTPDAVKKGSELFAANCVACHGPDGKAQHPAAAAMNPKPRNLVADKYKVGTSPLNLFNTLTGGLGNYMPAFGEILTPDERWALSHYVRSLMPESKRATINDEQIEEVCLELSRPPKPPAIPIELAMTILLDEHGARRAYDADQYGDVKLNKEGDVAYGKALYGAQCASCHGAQAQGVEDLARFGRFPFVEISTSPLTNNYAGGTWSVFTERVAAVHTTLTDIGTMGAFDERDWKSLQAFMGTLKGSAKITTDEPPPAPKPTALLLTSTEAYDLIAIGAKVFRVDAKPAEGAERTKAITDYAEFLTLYKPVPLAEDAKPLELPKELAEDAKTVKATALGGMACATAQTGCGGNADAMSKATPTEVTLDFAAAASKDGE